MIRKILPYATGINLVIGLVLLNLATSYFPFWRLDLSRGKVHSLNQATVKIIKQIDDIVSIKLYATEDLPPEAKPTADNLKTILKEMARVNPGKIKIEYLDPSKEEKVKEEALGLGIQPLQFSSVKSDKFEISQGYLGLVLGFGGKQEVVPVAGDVDNMEYILMSSLARLRRDKAIKIVLAETSQEEDGPGLLKRLLGKEYQLEEIKLEEDFKIASDAASLVILGYPKIAEKGVEKIDQWIKAGKGLVVFASPIRVDSSMTAIKNEETGLGELLKKYGITIEQKLVTDQSSAIANFRTQNGAFLSQYPYWVQVRPENIDYSMPVTSGISNLLLPWVSPVGANGEAKNWLWSSQMVRTTSDFSDLAPDMVKRIDGKSERVGLAAINMKGVKLAVVGNSDFVNDQFVYNSQQNLGLALNLIDYLSANSELLSIRSKNLTANPLRQIDDKTKSLIKTINLAAPMIMLGIIWVINQVNRRRKNENWARKTR